MTIIDDWKLCGVLWSVVEDCRLLSSLVKTSKYYCTLLYDTVACPDKQVWTIIACYVAHFR